LKNINEQENKEDKMNNITPFKAKDGDNEMISIYEMDAGYGNTTVLHDISLKIKKGEFIGIIGSSGAGKSTLLSTVIGKVRIQKGIMNVLDYNMGSISKKELMSLRSKVGFIFQGFNLVNRLSVLDNVMTGMLPQVSLFRSLIKMYKHTNFEKVYEILKVVGLEEKALQRCDQLSGGQRQRVAIARALAQDPIVILADEPVAALDPISAKNVMETLKKVNEVFGVTVIANLHQLEIAKEYCQRVIGINSGKIVFDGAINKLDQDEINEIYENTDDCDLYCDDDIFSNIKSEVEALA